MNQFFWLPLFACSGVVAQDLFMAQNAHTAPSALAVTGFSLAGLTFEGKGSLEVNPSEDPNSVKYRFSSGFQGQICSSCKDTHCWGSQGISKYGDYITRSFYEKDDRDTCSNPNARYFAISVMRRGNATYSNILVENGLVQRSCHAGGHVLRKVEGVFWFFVACTDHVSIFSEESIQKQTNVIQGKTFYYYVSGADVTILENGGTTSFSFLSRKDGTVDEFYSGRYNKTESTSEALNLQRIQISTMGNVWSLKVLEVFGVKSSVAIKVQGATMIGDYMYLTTSKHIRRCTVEEGNSLNYCMQQCQIPGTEFLVLQDAETDGDGPDASLYIGTEFNYDNKPFFEIKNIGMGAATDAEQDCFKASWSGKQIV